MPSSSCEISNDSKVSHLVKLCSSKELKNTFLKYSLDCFTGFESGEMYFITIALDPRKKIDIRGKKVFYNDCTVQNQYRWFKRRFKYYCKEIFPTMKDYDFLFFIPEHFKDGNVHYHLIVQTSDYKQNISVLMKYLFDIENCKTDSIQIRIEPVECPEITLDYFIKDGEYTIQCHHLKCSQEEWAESIKRKQYEVSRFEGGFYIWEKYHNEIFPPQEPIEEFLDFND